MSLLPHWRPGDPEALQERVRRRAHPPVIAMAAHVAKPDPPLRCDLGCMTGDHSHASRQVGSFALCVCLNCPVLVL